MKQLIMFLAVTLIMQGQGSLPRSLQRVASLTKKDFWKRCQHSVQNETIIGLMVTGKDAAHAWLAEQAVNNFFNQTYPSKALVVINDSPLYRLAPLFNNPCLIELNATTYTTSGELERWSLGELRNLGLAVIPSSAVWSQWDDDDYRAPGYLAGHYHALMDTNAPYVLIKRQLRVFLASNYSYIYETRPNDEFPFVIGSIMARKSRLASKVQYPGLTKAEDTSFLRRMKATVGPVTVWDNPPDMYFYIFHGKNTWSADNFGLLGMLPNHWCQQIAGTKHLVISKSKCSSDGWKLHGAVMERYKPFLQ